MKPRPLLKTGDRVRITYASRAVDATVTLASDNGRAVGLAFDAVLGIYAGQMPVFWRAGLFRDLFTEQFVTIVTIETIGRSGATN